MNLAVIFREVAGQLLPGQNIRHRVESGDTFERVMIGDGDKIHPAPLGLLVNFLRRTEAFRTLNGVQDRFVSLVAGIAMAVKIDARAWKIDRPGGVSQSLVREGFAVKDSVRHD